jgi:hypothetical protein
VKEGSLKRMIMGEPEGTLVHVWLVGLFLKNQKPFVTSKRFFCALIISVVVK